MWDAGSSGAFMAGNRQSAVVNMTQGDGGPHRDADPGPYNPPRMSLGKSSWRKDRIHWVLMASTSLFEFSKPQAYPRACAAGMSLPLPLENNACYRNSQFITS